MVCSFNELLNLFVQAELYLAFFMHYTSTYFWLAAKSIARSGGDKK